MNRNEAKQYIGKTVMIDEGNEGAYYGLLEDIIAEPRKPWKGIVSIHGVATYPSLKTISKPKYKDGDRFECVGGKIKVPQTSPSGTYQETLQTAVETKKRELLNEKKKLENDLSLLEDLPGISSDTNEFITYYVRQHGKDLYLQDIQNNEMMDLEGCPFEFHVKEKGHWVKAYHGENGIFFTEDGRRVQVKDGHKVRLHPAQFEPYHIFLHELEKPARKSLEKAIHSFGITKDDLKECHNTLLHQLLQADQQTHFEGVNFLLFQTSTVTLIVQHHYERELKDEEQDVVYDRFEFTTDKNHRSIITYTNVFTKDR